MKYFEKPTQVQFYDSDNDTWIGGIAYRDEIICGECGAIIEISDLREEDILAYKYWVSFSEEILD